MDIKLGYQIYSAREEAEKDFDAVCAKLKEFGYDGVEFAGFYGYTADDIIAVLKKYDLAAVSSHVPYDSIIADMDGTIAFHKAIGCKFIAIPFLDDATRPGAAGFAATIKNIYKFGKMIKEAGMQLLYHNHDFEFCSVSGQYGLDFLYDAVPECILHTEIDCCWVRYAGENPADYIKKYAGRCEVVHLKDYVGRKEEGKNPYALIGVDKDTAKADEGVAFEFRPVGYGEQDVPAIIESAQASGAEWFIVEQDLSVGRPPLEACKMSIEYLKSIGM